MRTVAAALTRWQTARAVRSLSASVEVAVAATIMPVLGACRERRKVFYSTDDFGAGASLMGVPESWSKRREASAVADADIVIAVSAHLASTLRRRLGVDAVVIENGVDDALFAGTDDAPLPLDVSLPTPIAGFVGHLSNRIDLRMLEAVAETGASILLVGPKQHTFEIERIHRLLARPNVAWVGAKPFGDLPSYLRVMQVGLLPYEDTAFNRSSFPLKVLEYLAAGRAAVSTDLPAVRALGDTVRIAGTPAEFADLVTQALAEPADPDAIAKRSAVAKEHSWDAAATRFAEVIGLT